MGMNVAAVSYYQNIYPFVDVVKNTGPGGPGANYTYNSSTRWIDALIPGATWELVLALNMDADYGYFPPGNYKVVSTSGAVINMAASPGISVTSTGVNLCLFTATTLPGSWDTLNARIQLTNSTGGNINIHDCYCCLVSEESRLLADPDAFKQDYLNFHSRARMLRFMDWMATINNPYSTLAEYGLQTNARRCYATDYPSLPPWRIAAKLCHEIGCDLWICLPMGNKCRAMSFTGATTSVFTGYNEQASTTVEPHQLVNGERIMFTNKLSGYYPTQMAPFADNTVYYVVNATSTTFQLSATSGGSPILSSTGINCGTIYDGGDATYGSIDSDYTGFYTAVANEIYAHYPSLTVWVECGNENWSFTNDSWHQMGSSISYTATGSVGQRGANSWQMLKAWAAFESVFPPSQVRRIFAWQLSANVGDLDPGFFSFVDPGIISAGQTFGQIISASLTRSFYAVAPYMTPRDSHGVTNPSFDQMYADNGNTNTVSLSYFNTVMGNALSDTEAYVSTTCQDARNNIANWVIVNYEGGFQTYNLGGNAVNANPRTMTAAFLTHLNSADGQAWYQSWYNYCIAPGGPHGGFQMMNQYYDLGGTLTLGNYFYAWGLKPNQGAADNARSLYVQGLP
jgi:hypothetical protein